MSIIYADSYSHSDGHAYTYGNGFADTNTYTMQWHGYFERELGFCNCAGVAAGLDSD